jgi:ABC-type bacteriocin/lantibiotic exporter with double-glycine peptidase domain
MPGLNPYNYPRVDRTQFRLFLKFLKFLIPYRRKQIIIFVLSGISVLLSLFNPYLSKLIVDQAIINKDVKAFVVLGIIGAVVFILNGLAQALATFLEKDISLRLHFDLNKKIFGHLQQLPLDFFKNKSTGEHMFNINYDIVQVVDLVSSVPKETVNIFPKTFFILVIIFFLNWPIALFSLVLVPVFFLPLYYLTYRMGHVFKNLTYNSQNVFKMIEEIFSHIYLIKAFGSERSETKNYLRALIANMKLRFKNIRLEVVNNFSVGWFNRVVVGLMTLFGGFEVIKGRATMGTFTAIMIYLAELISMENSFIFFFQRVNFGLICCGRLDKILDEKPKISRFSPKKNFQEPGIQFKKVSFGYKPKEYVLKNIDFNMEERMMALVGPSGCGKTTMLNMLLGLYEPWDGEIFIEGRNTNNSAFLSFRDRIGVALQEPLLWNDTVENNIKYAKKDASREEILKFAEITGVDEFVNVLADGYDTVIGERGCRFSEGQKQKIALARALIKNPKILILDEAMSSMDSLSEEKIMGQIKKLSGINIILVVSHRLSTVLSCESAYFLKSPDTMIIDQPHRLLEKDKAFADLFADQIKY